MKRVQTFILVLIAVFLVFLAAIFSLSDIETHVVSQFSSAVISLIHNLASIGLFLLVFWHFFEPAKSEPSRSLSAPTLTGWRSFFFIIGICVLTVIVVNPRGLYGFRVFPQLANALKQEKIQYYNSLDSVPDIIILGSSRSLTISPSYIRKNLELSAFNFGFSGISPYEFSLQGDLIYSDQKSEFPSVLLFEISPSNLEDINKENSAEMPIEFLPYMTTNKAAKFLLDRYLLLFNIHQFSESVYVWQYVSEDHVPQNYWEVQPDGYARFYQPDTLAQALTRQMKARENNEPCEHFSKDGYKLIEKFVSLATQKNSSIIFYFSPIHPTFKLEYLDKTSRYEWCKKIFLDLMQKATNENTSIYFLDLSNPETAHLTIDDSGFYDGFHITPANAEKIIDYLAPTIQQAYHTAQTNREQQP